MQGIATGGRGAGPQGVPGAAGESGLTQDTGNAEAKTP